MESTAQHQASPEAVPSDNIDGEPQSGLDDSWFDHRRPRSLFPKPEPGIDPLADDWFR